MQVLVTGSAGFIGSHLCERLLRQGHRVTGLDNFHDNYAPLIKRQSTAQLSTYDAFDFIQGDIRSSIALTKALAKKPDVIVHLAALVGVRDSLENPAHYADVNVHGTALLMEIARKAGVRRFILASSSSVYGGGAQTPFSESGALGLPLSPYAASKRAMELMAQTAQHLHGLRVAMLRFFTVYGPRQRPDLAIHKFINLMAKGESIPRYGDGTSVRDYTHISDILRGIDGAIHWTENQESAARAFNLASGRTITLNDMIQQVEKASGLPAKIEALPEQPGDMPATWGDIARAAEELSYAPNMPFDKGIAQFVKWYQSTQGQLSSIAG